MKFQTFEDVQCFLDDLNQHHINLGLDRMKQALVKLNLDSLPCKVVQVVGTNGKGSTVTFLSSLAQAHGLKVGLYTSPHFVTPRERVCINGKMISPNIWCKNIEDIISKVSSVTYFELITLFAIYTFVDSGVDLIVLEAGLGGKYDATTAVEVDLVCYTPITLDHEKFLGNTISQIAEEKAQAIRESKLVLTGPQEQEVFDVISLMAKEKKAHFYSVDQQSLPYNISCFDYSFTYHDKKNIDPMYKPKLGLTGGHQVMNASLALYAWHLLAQEYNWTTESASIHHGLTHAYIPGRLQSVEIDSRKGCLPIVLDGAHNPNAVECIALELQLSGIEPSAVIFSCFADKNFQQMIGTIEKIACNAPIIIPTIQVHDRAIDSQELVRYFNAPHVIPVQRLNLALSYIIEAEIQVSVQKPVLIIGSLYLLGEFFTLYPQTLGL